MNVAAANADPLPHLTLTSAARYTADVKPAQKPGPRRGNRRTRPRPGRVRASNNFGEAVMCNFILPIKEDA